MFQLQYNAKKNRPSIKGYNSGPAQNKILVITDGAVSYRSLVRGELNELSHKNMPVRFVALGRTAGEHLTNPDNALIPPEHSFIQQSSRGGFGMSWWRRFFRRRNRNRKGKKVSKTELEQLNSEQFVSNVLSSVCSSLYVKPKEPCLTKKQLEEAVKEKEEEQADLLKNLKEDNKAQQEKAAELARELERSQDKAKNLEATKRAAVGKQKDAEEKSKQLKSQITDLESQKKDLKKDLKEVEERAKECELPTFFSGSTGDTLKHHEKFIDFANAVPGGVVMLGALSYDGPDAAVAQLTRTNTKGFAVRVDEPECYRHWHTTERLDWLVQRKGVHKTEEGVGYELGVADLPKDDAEWKEVKFTTPMSADPVVFVTIQDSKAENDWQALRIKDVTKEGFRYRYQHAKKRPKRDHPDVEKLGWFAIPEGSGKLEGKKYTVGKTPNDVREKWYSQSVSGGWSNKALFFAQIQTYVGGDTSTVRVKKFRRGSLKKFQVRIQEPTGKKKRVRRGRRWTRETGCGWDGPHPGREGVGYMLLEG